MRRLFSDREFVAYFAARQSSQIATGIEDVAIGWQIFSVRHSPLDLGLVGLFLFLPQLLLAVPAGLIADRFDRRLVCVSSALGEGIALGAFVAMTFAHVAHIAPYFIAVGAVGFAHALGVPAQRAILAGIIKSAQFVRAQALSSSVGELVNIGAPALAGVLIAIATPIAFGAAALGYATAALAYASLTPRVPVTADAPLARSALDGLRYIFAHKVILGAISLDLFAVLFGGATALLPVFAVTILHVGATGFGILRSAPALGAALVAAFIVRRPIARGVGKLLYASVAGFGVAIIVFGLSKNFWLSIAALAVAGGFDMVSVVIRIMLVQLGTPDAMRGRVGAVENVFIGGSNELGAFESGTLAALIGTVGSVVAGGIATLVVIALWMGFFPQLRRADTITASAAPVLPNLPRA